MENYLASELLDFQHKGLGEAVTELSVWEKVLIYSYSLDGYEGLNEALRAGKAHRMEGVLNEALGKLPDIGDAVYRGALLAEHEKSIYVKHFQEQTPLVEPAFISSSTSKRVANLYSGADTLFYIESEHGKSIEQFSFYGKNHPQNEREILFKSKSIFIVDAVEKILRTTEIFLKEII